MTIAYNRDEGWSDCEAVHKTLDELIYVENFSAEEASKRVPVVMYLVACLLKNVPFEKDIDSAAYLGAGFISDELKALKSLRKVAPAGYACAVKADRLLNE